MLLPPYDLDMYIIVLIELAGSTHLHLRKAHLHSLDHLISEIDIQTMAEDLSNAQEDDED